MPPDGTKPPAALESLVAGSGRGYSLAEVAKHCTPDDCWLAVRGKVYDVTSWVAAHPGGSMARRMAGGGQSDGGLPPSVSHAAAPLQIYVSAGQDCTQLFDAYHPLRVSDMLPKYCVGELRLGPGELAPVSYEPELHPGGFYHTLKTRVEAYFRDTRQDPRVHPHMFVKTLLIVAGYLLCWRSTFFAPLPWLSAQLCVCVLLGVLKAEVGVSIMHDANHGAYSTSPVLGALAGASLDCCGASSFLWKQQHVAAHHVHTNVDGLDPDIRVGERDPYRAAPTQPLHPWHSRQHLYAPLLYCLLAAKNIVVDDFSTLASGLIAGRRIARPTPAERAQLWAGKALYASYWLLAPLAWGAHGLGGLVARWVFVEMVTGWTLALMFQVAHVVENITFPRFDPTTRRVPLGWAASQLAATADFAPGSFFWTHFSGGLNHQAVHHLFPGVCHVHYPALSKIVARTAKEHGVPYLTFPSFGDALRAHLRHLKRMGDQGVPFVLPALG